MHDQYVPSYSWLPQADRDLIQRALTLLSASVAGQVFDSPKVIQNYLTLRYADLEHEVFGVVWVNAHNRLIAEELLFRGTLTQTAVYPREVVKQALKRNAQGALFFHNHPSGCSEPSRADELLTKALRQALQLVEVRVLDHIVVSAHGAVSFAERGLL